MRREVGDKHGIANCLINLGELARCQGDYATTEQLSREGLSICLEMGDKPGIFNALINLGHAARQVGDLEEAQTLFMDSLDVLRDLEDKQGYVTLLIALAGLARSQGQHRKAAVLLGAAGALLESIGARLYAPTSFEYEQHIEATRAAPGASAWSSAWEEGRALTPERALEEIRSQSQAILRTRDMGSDSKKL